MKHCFDQWRLGRRLTGHRHYVADMTWRAADAEGVVCQANVAASEWGRSPSGGAGNSAHKLVI